LPTTEKPPEPLKAVGDVLEAGLFRSRWLLAPLYVGLVFSLVLLLSVFARQLVHAAQYFFSEETEPVILACLTLIDLSLVANLVLIVIFSGYENFVSRIDTGGSEDRPHWMGTLDFSGLKMKLIGSIVAISAISLLRAFMELTLPNATLDQPKLTWLIGLHMTFVVSGVLFALMDYLAVRTEAQNGHKSRS